MSRFHSWSLMLAACLLGGMTSTDADGATPFTLSDYPAVRRKVLDWADARLVSLAEDRRPEGSRLLKDLWPEQSAATSDVWWSHALKTFSEFDEPTRKFLTQLDRSVNLPRPPDTALLFGANPSPFYVANLKLEYVRWLARRGDCDAAYELLQQIPTTEIISPSAYLFYKAVCEKQLLKREPALRTLESLQALPSARTPQRFTQAARLMTAELERLEPDSLEEVAGLMTDVERRLKLSQMGTKTQAVENRIVAHLDQLIKKLEDKQNQSQSSSNSSSPSKSPQSPAQESRVKGSVAPGDVDRRKLSSEGSWGNLRDKERTRAKNLIARDFPAHYRQAIEEYFRKLATRDDQRR